MCEESNHENVQVCLKAERASVHTPTLEYENTCLKREDVGDIWMQTPDRWTINTHVCSTDANPSVHV